MKALLRKIFRAKEKHDFDLDNPTTQWFRCECKKCGKVRWLDGQEFSINSEGLSPIKKKVTMTFDDFVELWNECGGRMLVRNKNSDSVSSWYLIQKYNPQDVNEKYLIVANKCYELSNLVYTTDLGKNIHEFTKEV